MTPSTVISTISTFLATRLVSFLKKRSIRFRKLKSTWIALFISILSVGLISFIAPSLQKGGIDIPKIPKLVFEVLVSWLSSGGIYQAGKSIAGRDKPATMTVSGSDPSLYEDFMNHGTTYLVPVSGEEDELYYPLEYFFKPTVMSKLFIESVGDPNIISSSDMGVGMISHLLLFKLMPFSNSFFTGKVKKITVPWIYLIDPDVEIDLFNYAVVEHSVISTLIGEDRVRTVVTDKAVFNIFYTGSSWYTVSGFKKYEITSDHMYLSGRGVIRANGVELDITNGVFSGTSNVRKLLRDMWAATDLKKDVDERSSYPGYMKFLKKVWDADKSVMNKNKVSK